MGRGRSLVKNLGPDRLGCAAAHRATATAVCQDFAWKLRCMVNELSGLVSEIASNEGLRVLLALAAYPRCGWTGELGRIGQVVGCALCHLSQQGGRTFRVMHGQGAALMPHGDDIVALVQAVVLNCGVPQVEMRWLIAPFSGHREAKWLDEILGDLSVRANFGRFSLDPVIRVVDCHVWPETFADSRRQ